MRFSIGSDSGKKNAICIKVKIEIVSATYTVPIYPNPITLTKVKNKF